MTSRPESLHILVEQYRQRAQECIEALQHHLAQENGTEAATASLRSLQEARSRFGHIKLKLLERCGYDNERANDIAALDHRAARAHMMRIVQEYKAAPRVYNAEEEASVGTTEKAEV